ncbi:GNAT family N-acetyltransferase [Streptomyces sp. NBC_00140]|uniref:GNAT family N-acetyltransferase n=1 Tax=Streptomyces sp. NBC_00140 TaxID=2975664 RepID=UPI002255AFFD|nr:GNAT family N-acetyltransferase [Streptomyces sp. NBC_00140]MCX5329034.1 GNAT family N-acetyltransferase [Streptomyces sp. NBC_00140]
MHATPAHRPLTLENAPALAELFAAVEAADGTDEHYDAEDLADELGDPRLELPHDSAGVWSRGELIGYAKATGLPDATDVHLVYVEGAVRPDARGQGVGAGLVTWQVTRAAQLHRERFPDLPGEAHIQIHAPNTAKRDLYQGAGFQARRWFFDMRRPLDGGEIPVTAPAGGLRVVPFTTAYDEATRLAHNEAFRDHWGHTPTAADRWRHGTTGARSFRPDLSFLALDGDEVAGYLISHEYDAETAMTGIRECWIAQLGTRPGWRGGGVATALLTTCLRAAQEQGFRRAGLNVDSANANGALSLYERCGFRTLHTWIGYVKPL